MTCHLRLSYPLFCTKQKEHPLVGVCIWKLPSDCKNQGILIRWPWIILYSADELSFGQRSVLIHNKDVILNLLLQKCIKSTMKISMNHFSWKWMKNKPYFTFLSWEKNKRIRNQLEVMQWFTMYIYRKKYSPYFSAKSKEFYRFLFF